MAFNEGDDVTLEPIRLYSHEIRFLRLLLKKRLNENPNSQTKKLLELLLKRLDVK